MRLIYERHVPETLIMMSQGELHALGLSLFLPRATVEQSPFRFVLIDDPVQAMDPAKVDGLARVLGDVAADRQVVVFTHDDRLADAVRRLEIPATVWEVQRGERSTVELQRNADPVSRYLDDARAIAQSATISPRVHYLDATARTKVIYVGYVGAHLPLSTR